MSDLFLELSHRIIEKIGVLGLLEKGIEAPRILKPFMLRQLEVVEATHARPALGESHHSATLIVDAVQILPLAIARVLPDHFNDILLIDDKSEENCIEQE
jgi:hypothetical protein